MSKHTESKYFLNVPAVKKIMEERNISIRGLGRDASFPFCEKTIRRAFKSEEGTLRIFTALCQYFNIPFHVLSDSITSEKNTPFEGVSRYAKIFDASSSAWSATPEYNRIFLKCQERYANDLLQVRGHIFLNEVYDHLGLSRTQIGTVVGWVKTHVNSHVNFEISNLESFILIDFNVDGCIIDLQKVIEALK